MEIFTKPIAAIFIGFIKLYQLIISPMFVSSCRHQPTCSEYCVEAIKAHGLIYGCYIGLKRILRCRPGGSSGYDPVPEKNEQ